MANIEAQNQTPEQALSGKLLLEAEAMTRSLGSERDQKQLDAQMDSLISGIEGAADRGEITGSTGKQYSREDILNHLSVLSSLIEDAKKDGEPVPMRVLPRPLRESFSLLVNNEATSRALQGSIDIAAAILKEEQAGQRQPAPRVGDIPFSDKFPRSEVGAAKTIVGLEAMMSGGESLDDEEQEREQTIENLSEEATSAAGIENPTEHEAAGHFTLGQEVSVRRSGGAMESGWTVDFINKVDGTAIVSSPDKTLEKTYKASELLRLNPIEAPAEQAARWPRTHEEYEKLLNDLNDKKLQQALKNSTEPFYGDETDEGGVNGNAMSPKELQELLQEVQKTEVGVQPEIQEAAMTHEQKLAEITQHLSSQDKTLLDSYALAAAAANRAARNGESDNKRYYDAEKTKALNQMSADAYDLAAAYFKTKYPE